MKYKASKYLRGSRHMDTCVPNNCAVKGMVHHTLNYLVNTLIYCQICDQSNYEVYALNWLEYIV